MKYQNPYTREYDMDIHYPMDYRVIYSSSWSSSDKITSDKLQEAIDNCTKEHPKATGAYTDRMFQWDRHKAQQSMMKASNGKTEGDLAFSGLSMNEIETFLQDYNKDKTVKLLTVIPIVNQGNGYPLWYLMWESKTSK